MVINTNLGALKAQRMLSASTGDLNASLARLASGSKIVSPQDDSAGLALVSKLGAQMNRNRAVESNLTSALSFSQTQDGFLSKVMKALDRMSELSVLADQDDLQTSSDLANYETEFDDLRVYISDIGTKDFNGVSLFDGEDIFVTKDSDGKVWELNDSDLNGESIDDVINGSFSVTQWNAPDTLKEAIEDVAAHRVQIGANIQRIQFTQEQVNILNENLAATVSRIKDVDVAEESTQFARHKILVQSGTSMLAQANLIPQNILRLLG